VYILINTHRVPAEGSFCDVHGIAQGYVTVENYN